MINKNVRLIEPSAIKDKSIYFQNVEEKFINPLIIDVQNEYIQETLLSNLYNIVIEQYKAYKTTGTTLETRIETLIEDYLQPIITKYVIYKAFLYGYFKLTPQGTLLSKATENGNTIDLESIKYFSKFLKSEADFYLNRLNNFLIDNTDTYPEYLNIDDENEDIINTQKPYSNFYIGGLGTTRYTRSRGACN